jgi:RING finger protein 113A
MFKKRSKPKKASLRRKQDDGDDEQDEDTRQSLEEAVRANKKSKTSHQDDSAPLSSVMHQYAAASEKPKSAAELATSTAQHHPEQKADADTAERGEDGIFRDKTRNKFLAGPIKASAFVRTTCRFDYQPDICKDYKDTGFCGFGDTCIYLHDRGDTLTGWQLEQQWEEQRKKDLQKREMDAFATEGKTPDEVKPLVNTDDGLPFACHLCREAFKEPVVTSCGHYFCEACIMSHTRQSEKGTCPICNKDTHGVFNQPTKLLMKKRRLLGSKATWQEFADASKGSNDGETKEK